MKVLHKRLADHWQKANVSILQGKSRLEKAFPQPVGKTASALRTIIGLDSILDCMAASHSLLRPRCQLCVGP